MQKRRWGVSLFSWVAVLVLGLGLLAACGEEDAGGAGPTATPAVTPTPTNPPSPTADPDAIVYPTGKDDIVLLIETTGGFVPPHVLTTTLPTFVLLGDGSIVTQGPMIEIYPAPALPNLRVTRLSEAGVQALLKEARAAGLLDGDADYPLNGIADAPTTYFVTNAGGMVSNVSAYALGMEYDDPMATPEVTAAREQLVAFQAKLTDLAAWLPAGSILTEDEEFAITRMQLVTQVADVAFGDESVEPQVKEWPLTTTPDTIGEPFFMEQSRCVVLEGTDLDTLLTALADANQLTRWTSGETEYVIYIRPLIGAQEGCIAPGM